MRSGTLRHRMVIQRQYEQKDSYGAVTKSWDNFAQVWGAIRPLLPREYFAAKQTLSKATHKINIRYLSGLTNEMRILFDGRYFQIEAIMNVDERNYEHIVYAVEGPQQ